MFNQKNIVKLVAASVVAFALAGCGSGGNPAGVDDGSTGIDSGTGYTDPGTNPYGGTTGTGTNPYGGTTATTPVADTAQLTASITKKKNGSFLGMGKFTCTVEVTNPGTTSHSGTLTVTFKNGKKVSATAPITKQVTLGPNETQSFDFEDKKWTTDSVDCDVTTDASAAAAPMASMATTGAMGTTGAASAYPTGY
ncbi:MAG: hypothetical protein JWM80_1435 [Cyanobacteria bacterium RYN_339]|nr:hypothetical protein [Cyanobacteria bacterium RYN_339]